MIECFHLELRERQKCRLSLHIEHVMWIMRHTNLSSGNLLFENMVRVPDWFSGFGDELPRSEEVSSSSKCLVSIGLLMLGALFQLFKSSDFTQRISFFFFFWCGRSDRAWQSIVLWGIQMCLGILPASPLPGCVCDLKTHFNKSVVLCFPTGLNSLVALKC